MLTAEQIKDLDKLNEMNPWRGADKNIQILEKDEKRISHLKNFLGWGNLNNPKYKFEDQFPLPINGNFINAKYLLLYSNPSSEKDTLKEETKEKLLKCFNLNEDAELIIDNAEWKEWYIKQLNRFFTFVKDSQNKPSEKEVKNFLNKFCFVNFCAYATANNSFSSLSSQKYDDISELPSTKFVIDLVKLWKKWGKKIIIVRTTEKVWRDRVFDKLEF